MDLAKAMNPFASSFYDYSGFGFKGQLLAVPMEESATYFLLPRRILKLYPNTRVRPGARIREENTGKQYFAGENGPSLFGDRVIHKTLKLFEINHTAATLVRSGQVVDNITGLPKKVTPGTPVTIPAVIEFTKTQEDEMRIGADLVRIVTKDQVFPNDKINEYTVVNTEAQLGLYFSTARRS